MGVPGSIFCESIKVHLYLGSVKSEGLVFGLFIFGPFLDALASLDFKLLLSQRFTFFTASASTGLSELFFVFHCCSRTRPVLLLILSEKFNNPKTFPLSLTNDVFSSISRRAKQLKI